VAADPIRPRRRCPWSCASTQAKPFTTIGRTRQCQSSAASAEMTITSGNIWNAKLVMPAGSVTANGAARRPHSRRRTTFPPSSPPSAHRPRRSARTARSRAGTFSSSSASAICSANPTTTVRSGNARRFSENRPGQREDDQMPSRLEMKKKHGLEASATQILLYRDSPSEEVTGGNLTPVRELSRAMTMPASIRGFHDRTRPVRDRRACRRARHSAADPRAVPFLRRAWLSRREMVRSAGGQGLSLGRVLLRAVGLRAHLCLWREVARILARWRLCAVPQGAPGAALSAASDDAVRDPGHGDRVARLAARGGYVSIYDEPYHPINTWPTFIANLFLVQAWNFFPICRGTARRGSSASNSCCACCFPSISDRARRLALGALGLIACRKRARLRFLRPVEARPRSHLSQRHLRGMAAFAVGVGWRCFASRSPRADRRCRISLFRWRRSPCSGSASRHLRHRLGAPTAKTSTPRCR
jgi:hypothetical protein